jgi:hypothetical protein
LIKSQNKFGTLPNELSTATKPVFTELSESLPLRRLQAKR